MGFASAGQLHVTDEFYLYLCHHCDKTIPKGSIFDKDQNMIKTGRDTEVQEIESILLYIESDC